MRRSFQRWASWCAPRASRSASWSGSRSSPGASGSPGGPRALGAPSVPSAGGPTVLLALLLAACGRSAPEPGGFELAHRLASAARCRVSVPDAETLELVRASIARRPAPGLVFEVAVESAPPEDLALEPRVWVGTPGTAGAERALAALGVAREGAGFRFRGLAFDGVADGLVATVPDPERPGAILAVVLGNQVEVAVRRVRDWTPTARLGWQAFRGGAVSGEGAVLPDGRPAAEGALDVAALDLAESQGARQGERVDYDWTAPASFDPEANEAWLATLDRAAALVRLRLGSLMPFDAELRVALRLFETPEDLARTCRVRGLAHVRGLGDRDELGLVHVAGWPDNGPFELARTVALAGAGEPASAWLAEAVAAASAESWFGRPGASWLAHLASGELLADVNALVREAPREGAGLSPHQRAPLRGALLLCCEEQYGADFVSRAWRAAPETLELPSDQAFRAWLARSLAGELDAARASRVARHAASLARPARRGACFVPGPPTRAPDADPLAGGFGSRACEQSLARLGKLGASAVALAWCSALEPSPPRVFGAGALPWTQADDAALFATILAAQSQGLAVTLLPQVAATEHGGWAGQVLLTTPRRRRELFDDWTRAVTHLGLLAELAGVDVLSLGTEVPDTTVTRSLPHNRRPAEELDALRSDWQLLIQAGRGAFAGGLTYAARWDGEAQGIEFFGDLDFLGQNVFAPIGEPGAAAAPTAAEFTQWIVASLGHLRQLAAASGARPLVCSIGLSSTAEGWRRPSRPQGELDLDVQARFYDGLMRALQLARRQELSPAGLFVWCWWSDAQAGGPTDRGFTPQNKPAEAALGRALQVR